MHNNALINNITSILDKTNNSQISCLYNNMSSFQKSIFDSWCANPDEFINYSFNDLLFDFDKNFVQKILEFEIDYYLNSINNSSNNKRNGYTKDINLKIGSKEIQINRPRLRNEKDFDSVFIPKRTRIMKDISDNIILLYSKNNSINDIKDILKAMFDIDISSGKISDLIQDISHQVYEWRNKKLDPCYFAINIDCTYISLRDFKDLNSHKIPVYVAVGTKLTGTKEILGIYLGNEDDNKHIIDNLYNQDIAEATSFWTSVFEDLKQRGVKKVLYLISDGLPGIKVATENAFDGVFYQRCIVHLVRNLKQYTTKQNCKFVISDFKQFYSAPSKELALQYWIEFTTKYQNNTVLFKHAQEYASYIMPLFDLPINIRKYIYTNNIAEAVNSKIKRGFYGRGALPNINSALNIIFLNLDNLEQKWRSKKVNNWSSIFNDLSIVHKDIIDTYL